MLHRSIAWLDFQDTLPIRYRGRHGTLAVVHQRTLVQQPTETTVDAQIRRKAAGKLDQIANRCSQFAARQVAFDRD